MFYEEKRGEGSPFSIENRLRGGGEEEGVEERKGYLNFLKGCRVSEGEEINQQRRRRGGGVTIPRGGSLFNSR